MVLPSELMVMENSFPLEGGNKCYHSQFLDYGWTIPSHCGLVNSQRKIEKSVLNEPDAPKHNPERRFLFVFPLEGLSGKLDW